MTAPTQDQLKTLISKLVTESEAVRPVARSQPPAFNAWKLRLKLLADQVGGTFQSEMQQALDYENDTAYWTRLREANSRRPGSLTESVINEWIVDAVLGLLHGLDAAVDDGMLLRIEDRVASDVYTGVLVEAVTQQQVNRPAIAAILMRVASRTGYAAWRGATR